MSTAYELARESYAKLGVDTEAALTTLNSIAISVHCWQGDDVTGFENSGESLSGGIQATGNYPGKARTPDELTSDLDMALSLVGGKQRLNLHASYAVFDGEPVDRDQLKPEHFQYWIDYAKARDMGLDFNPTFFSHPMIKDGLTLSSPDDTVRTFWVNHGIACRRISAAFAAATGKESLLDVWIPDGLKDVPADRLTPRLRLSDSLDKIFAEKLDGVVDCVESKVFGIGLESYTVGSNEFYVAYCGKHDNVYPLLDNGHYHPMENVADKISALLCSFDKLPFHLTRPVRWDSDHVVIYNDEMRELARELIRCNALDKAYIGLDFFDASINRIAAWVVGIRGLQKSLLEALLEPHNELVSMQDAGDFTSLLVAQEALKTAPIGAVWNEFCDRCGVPSDSDWLPMVRKYEDEVLSKRC